ncbi:MAG: DUF5106 domain-containing protein [Bacteroidales bacterium]|nr:DUF5106 domain-containing protein [Bacteroidales bacterium]
MCWLFVPTIFPAFTQGYEIKISFQGRNDTVILGHYFAKPDMLIPNDTVVLDRAGKGVFKGGSTLDRGVYFLINDRKKLFDIMIGDEQKFEISLDTTDLINKTKFKSSVENEVFFDFQRMNIQKGVRLHELRQEYEAAAGDKKKELLRQMQQLNRDRLAYIRQLADGNPGTFVRKFLQALIPADSDLPDYPRDADGKITDSTYVYRWYRAHFFDRFDIYDPDMLRTPLYEEKVMEYMTKVIHQHPDSVCAEADKILAKTRANDEMFRCVLVLLFNHYLKSEVIIHENVWVHLADKWYIPYASWSSADYIEKLKKEVKDRTPSLIGKQAPPLEMLMALPPDHFRAAALDTAIKFDLHAGVNIKDFRQSLKSKYTAILFWDIGCAHCRKTIQELFEAYDSLKEKGLTVITVQVVNTKDAKGKWIDFVNEHQLFGWTNAWSPYSVKYRTLYNVSTFPYIFLLNEKEEIIGKRLVPEQLKMFVGK